MPRLVSIFRAGRWSFGPALLLCLVGAGSRAPGQATPSKLSERRGITLTPAPAAEAPEKPAPGPEAKPEGAATAPSFFGDTKKFSRIGGWGSFGNAMGQFGFARSTLITMPPVQEELKLTDEQKEKLRLWQESMRKRGEEMGRSMREKGGDPFRGSESLSIAARVMQFTSLINQLSGMARENEAGLSKILNAPQRKRLNQISLQMEGITALTRPEIAEAVGLVPEEVEEIQQIIAQSRAQQMTTWIGSMMAMRPNRQAPADPNANPDRPRDPDAPPTAKAEAKPPRDGEPSGGAAAKVATDPKARADREKAMRQRFESMRDRTDQIQDGTVRQIARTLNKAQRTKFENMLGPPFDPKKINTFGRPPGRPAAPPAPAEKPTGGQAVTK